jgi:FMN phosphatase YigB (HAD superfamily)
MWSDSRPGPGRPELLLLDVTGVLLSDAIPAVFRDIAGSAGGRRTARELAALHRETLKADLWRGAITESQYWDAIAAFVGVDGRHAWRAALLRRYRPLVSGTWLRACAEVVPVWVLSNHRAEWASHVLWQTGLAPCLSRTFISSQRHVIKPEPAAFEQVLACWGGLPSRVLFVDERAGNLRAAERMGLAPLRADRRGRWALEVAGALGIAPPPARPRGH